ncbi:RNA polymerase sigma factor [Arsenicibacter rosenii]|uniref:RNA polymerase subunit sigma-24 n=1 Tax=Arsenicibacter rosenii TaxID=1750698 RepID=A0A1S2VRA0_9BACT|nr:sigma-70 family RNA polymerase sigma factor [Arsenicibacter rosenii]OIN60920.1 RNA polymerase subunit sigma-24 [Arsenicibacter rosenii]
MKNRLKDEELVTQYLVTSQSTYTELLYRRYAQKVYRRCFSLIKDPVLAEDFTQEIFLRVLHNLPNFKERSTFSTWLYAIAYNYCMDQIRHANRQTTVGIGEELIQTLTDEESDTIEFQLSHLSRVLQYLPADERTLLRLKYEEDQDIKALAHTLNIKDSAIKMRLKRSRDKIRRLYYNLA